MRIRSLPGTLVLVAGIVAAGVLAPMPALAKVALHMTLNMGSSCLGGDKPTSDPIKVKLLRSDGSALETTHDDTTSLIGWGICFQHHIPVAGEKLQMINGTTQDRTITIPDLTLVVDRVSSIAGGHGPAGKSIELTYTDCYPSGCDSPAPPFVLTVNSRGHYHKNLSASAFDIDGWDELQTDYVNSFQDRFTRATYAPYVEITKPNQIFVSCVPPGTTTVRLLTSTGTLRASRSFHATADCSGFFGSFRKNGHAVNVHVGDRITSSLATDARFTWPTMSITGALTGDSLLGTCLAHSRYVVFITRGGSGTTWSGTTDSHGILSGTPSWTFQTGDHLDLVCETHQGDHVRMARTL